MFSVFWWVERRFCENDNSLLRIAAEIIKKAAVPIFFHEVPVPDDSAVDGVDNFLSSSEISGFFSNGEIEGLCDFFIAECPADFGGLVCCVGNKGGDVEWGFGIAGVSHFGISCSIVNDCNSRIEIH